MASDMGGKVTCVRRNLGIPGDVSSNLAKLELSGGLPLERQEKGHMALIQYSFFGCWRQS